MAIENGSTVRWFHSDMVGAPQINRQAGDLIAILDACLIDGFGGATPDGDKITISGEVATVHFSGGHDFQTLAVIEIEGASIPQLNDVWRVKSATGSSFTFDCPGIPDGADSGAITVKRATPGFWEKTFTDTNKAVYRSTHPDATGFYMRVDSTPIDHALVRGYVTMSDVDTGSRPFPSVSQMPNPAWKLSESTSAPMYWSLFADESFIHFLPHWDVSPGEHPPVYQFGDVVTINPLDTEGCVIAVQDKDEGESSRGLHSNVYDKNKQSGCYWGVGAGTVGPESFYRLGYSLDPRTSGLDTSSPAPHPYPHGGGYAFYRPIFAMNLDAPRGEIPGQLQPLQSRNGTTLTDTNFIHVPEPAETQGLLVAMVTHCRVDYYSGHTAFDIGGPWR